MPVKSRHAFPVLLSSLTLCITIAAVFSSGCGGSKPGDIPNASAKPASGTTAKRLIFLTNGDDPFWDACNAGLIEGSKRFDIGAQGLSVVMEKNNGTAQGQIEKLRQFASQSDVAGVAISVIQAENVAIVEEMKSLSAKGVKVITVDADVNREKFRDARPWYIGTDNIVGGRVLGAAAKIILESRKKTEGGFVQFAGFTDNDNARDRMDGFKSAVGEQFQEVDRMSDEMDLSKARDNVRSALVNHPDLTALVGIWAYDAPAIAEVVQERGVREKVTVITFDAQASALEHMSEGRIDAMVAQNPFDMGIQTVRLLSAMIAGNEAVVKEMFPRAGEVDGDLYTTGLRLIVPDSGSPLKASDVDSGVVEFMPLTKFREWLATYKLSSS